MQHIGLINTLSKMHNITLHLIDENLGYTKSNIEEFIKNISLRFAELIIYDPIFNDAAVVIDILKLCEKENLSSTVEHLLLHRPLFLCEENILHPYAYVLLNKYQQPTVYKALEPQQYTQQIMDYFSQHPELDYVDEALQIIGKTL